MASSPSPGSGHHLSCASALLWLVLAACAGPDTSAQPAGAASADKIAVSVASAAASLEAGQPLDGRLARSDGEGRLEVYVYVTSIMAGDLDTLAAKGLKGGVASTMGLVQGWVRPQDLAQLAALPWVSRIALPHYAVPR